MFKIEQTKIQGCYILYPNRFSDNRGIFIKTYHEKFYEENNITAQFEEQFYTVSRKDVLRGLHFQAPPHEQSKLVYCTAGSVVDVVLDLRKGSPSYGDHIKVTISGSNLKQVLIPVGCAHGFFVTSDSATMIYNVTSTYSPDHDDGILWNSASIDWPISDPIVSERDGRLTRLRKFRSPFEFKPNICSY